MYKLKKALPVLLLTFIFTIMMGCAADKEEGDSTIKMGMMPITDNLPFWVAEQQGYFAELGLDVELIAFPSALERDTAFASGQIDAAIGDMLAVAAMNNGGTKVKAVAVGQGIVPGENRFAVLSAPDSGITTPEQLKGVAIAMSLNTINEYITDRLLQDEGLAYEEIHKTAVPKLPVRMEALMQGTVQAATLPDPMATLAMLNGANLVVDNSEKVVAQTVVIVQQQALDNKLQDVQKLMQAYSRAVPDIQAQPENYYDILTDKAQVPQELLEGETILNLNFLQPELPEADGVDSIVQWMLEYDLLRDQLTYEDLVDRRVLAK